MPTTLVCRGLPCASPESSIRERFAEKVKQVARLLSETQSTLGFETLAELLSRKVFESGVDQREHCARSLTDLQ